MERAKARSRDVSLGGGVPVGDVGFVLGVFTGALSAPLTRSPGLQCMSIRVISHAATALGRPNC